MIVCHCHVVTDGELHDVIAGGAHDLLAVAAACGAGSGCGGCLPVVRELLAERGHHADPLVTGQDLRLCLLRMGAWEYRTGAV